MRSAFYMCKIIGAVDEFRDDEEFADGEHTIDGMDCEIKSHNGFKFVSQCVLEMEEQNALIARWIAENVTKDVRNGKSVILDSANLNKLCKYLETLHCEDTDLVRSELIDWAIQSRNQDPTCKNRTWYYKVVA